MRSDREEELARTATAAVSATLGGNVAEPVGATLGRYRLERELGAGAMGVVHAAFDPDLERRIALKVLRSQAASPEARDRLLREARAMARLSHPNVVTVHEVGTAGGRDFVAMELIWGETLAEWLRQARRPPAAIVDAFLAAGRGLAAAHAAGIVHRDFKPHNVLRSRDGRIVVTDFGLAREADGALPPALEMTLPVGVASTSSTSSTPSTLAGLTVTGSLLGTPAYMAPEQWQGGQVTPATDQFAYCVALWEALAGSRPYPGPTFDDLRSQVARGPAALDASRIPRRVRGILRRGLDPDPARRWPSMDALLARLARTRRRTGIALAGSGVAAAAALVALILVLRPGAVPPPVCEPPKHDVATVWSPAIAAELRAKTSEAHEAVLAAAFRDWQTARTAACAAPPQVRQVQLSCLDGVLGRFDALRQAFAGGPGAAAEEIQAQLVDPAVCLKPAAAEVPRLTLAPKPEVIKAYALYGQSQTDQKPDDGKITELIDAQDADPCARVLATLAFGAASKDLLRARALMTSAVSVADQCGDERLRADLLIRSVPYQRELLLIGPRADAALKLAEVAANRVMQPDLAAAIASPRRAAARRQGQWEEAFRLVESEIAGYGARHLTGRQLQAALARSWLRNERADPGDLEAIAADVRTWRPIALAHHRGDLVWQLDFLEATARFGRGDVASAHADLQHLWQTRPASHRLASSHTIEGEVVDDRGRPVPGAMVAAAHYLGADSAGIGLYENDDTLQITTTDAAGRFALHDTAVMGAVAAQLADRRSRSSPIADRVRLVLEPTRSVSGRVKLDRTPATRVAVVAESGGIAFPIFYTTAPVAPDGTFSLSGASIGPIRIGALVQNRGAEGVRVEFRSLPASPRAIVDLELALPGSGRAVDVVVRSSVAAPIEAADVFLLPGKQQVKNFGELFQLRSAGLQEAFAQPVIGGRGSAPLIGTIHSGDLLAHVEHAGQGVLTVCACSLPGDLADPAIAQRVQAHLSQVAVTCTQLGPDASVVVLEVPPQQRID